MDTIAQCQPTVVRTERGLTISGSRITLYDVMDYVNAGWPAKLIRDRLQLTGRQMEDVMAYIEAHRVEVEREYQLVIQTTEENRRYWERHNQERLAQKPPAPSNPEKESLRAKLDAWKARQGMP